MTEPLAEYSNEQFVAEIESGLQQCLGLIESKSDTTKILIAHSGGPDSTALLSALCTIAGKLRLQLNACHVNHHLRGEESDADQAFCEKLCQSLGVPIQIQHAEKNKEENTSEESLRASRFALLAKSAQACGANLICLGHTLDDQVETMLFRLFRGTGPQGLLGMEPVRNLNEDLLLVRPMLQVRRKQCLDYLEHLGIVPRHDSSNDQTNYTRNYLRKEVIPLVESRFGDFQFRVDQLREIMAVDDEFLSQLADEAREKVADKNNQNIWSLTEFCQLPLALSRRLIVQAMEQRGIEPSFDLVEKILALKNSPNANWALSINGRWDIRLADESKSNQKIIRWIDKQTPKRDQNGDTSWQQELRVPGVNLLASRNQALKIELLASAQPINFPKADANEALVDLAKVSLPLVVRYRQPGDLMQPFGMNQQVKLKKYLHTHKSTKESKDAKVLVVADQNEIIWIPGIGLSNKVRVSGRPSHRLSLIPLAPDSMPFA
jgi:tRNA(Ile)-lysidine synthase